MTSPDGRAPRSDDDLAPVTDLFGARSRRGAERRQTPDPALETDTDPRDQSATAHAAVAQPLLGADADADAEPLVPQPFHGADADAPVPLPTVLRGAQAQAEWVSPVVGDTSGRSTRAEHGGYDHDAEADAPTASVFAIVGGDELDPEDVPRPIAEQRADAELFSMRALGRRGVSTSEMRKTLTQHDLDPDVVEGEIERLTRVGLLDDVALATDLVDRLHERKGLGRQGVVAELRRRGIDQVAIDAALDAAADDQDDEFVRALDLAAKRAGQLRGLDRATAERRLSGFLMRKGYGSGVVRIAVERALDGSAGRPRSGGGTVRFE